MLCSRARASSSLFKLTYDKPATKWTEALPLGNGRIGAMVFGGTSDDRLPINESTLWGSGPHDYVNPATNAHLAEIRQLIFAGKVSEAERLSASLMGRPRVLMPYQPFCDIHLQMPDLGTVRDYHRELDLNDATAVTAFTAGSTTFCREPSFLTPIGFSWFG